MSICKLLKSLTLSCAAEPFFPNSHDTAYVHRTRCDSTSLSATAAPSIPIEAENIIEKRVLSHLKTMLPRGNLNCQNMSLSVMRMMKNLIKAKTVS